MNASHAGCNSVGEINGDDRFVFVWILFLKYSCIKCTTQAESRVARGDWSNNDSTNQPKVFDSLMSEMIVVSIVFYPYLV